MTDDSPAILRALRALESEGLAWCLLRGAAELPAPSGDVDILVKPADAERASTLLSEMGFAPERSWAGGSQRFFLGREPADGSFVLVQMTTSVSFGRWYELELPVGEACIDRSTMADGLRITAEPDEFWISLLHCLLDKGTVTPKHRLRLPELQPKAGEDDHVALEVRRLCGAAWDAAGLLHAVGERRWDDVEAAAGPLRRAWTRRSRGAQFRAVRHAASLWGRKLTEPVTKPGVSCALLAPDGAGKSTIAAELPSYLPRPVRVVYLGAYGAGTRGSSLPLPGADAVVRLARMWTRWLTGQWHTRRRRFVVYDRHPVELRIGGEGGRRTRWRRRIMAAVPLPDVVIVLDAPADVLHARKAEHDLPTLEAMRARYRRIADALPQATVVDASRPADVVCRDVAAAMWECRTRRK